MSLHERTRNSTIYTININFCYFLLFFNKTSTKKSKRSQSYGRVLKRGDEVITSGGIIGVVDRVMEDDRIEVIIGEGTKGSNNKINNYKFA